MDNIDNTAGQPFTLVDIPGGVLTLYGLANGIAAASGMMKMYTDKKNGEKKEGE